MALIDTKGKEGFIGIDLSNSEDSKGLVYFKRRNSGLSKKTLVKGKKTKVKIKTRIQSSKLRVGPSLPTELIQPNQNQFSLEVVIALTKTIIYPSLLKKLAISHSFELF